MAAPMSKSFMLGFRQISRFKQALVRDETATKIIFDDIQYDSMVDRDIIGWETVQPVRCTQTVPWYIRELQRKSDLSSDREEPDPNDFTEVTVPENFREKYPEFLPSPSHHHSRDRILMKLEHREMMKRRGVIDIPEFYVGSILSVTVADELAPGKRNRFVGICILRGGTGLRANFILRNCVDGEGIEICYHLYSPVIQSVRCLKLEKRLDSDLTYLRDAPLEYSTVPWDMDPVPHPRGAPVPVNTLVVPLKERKWRHRWYLRHDLKGFSFRKDQLNLPEYRFMALAHKPWEEYDLMKEYRETGSEQLKQHIYKNVYLQQAALDASKSQSRQEQRDQAKAKARVKRTKRAPVAGTVTGREYDT